MSLLITQRAVEEASGSVLGYFLNQGRLRRRPEFLQVHPREHAAGLTAILGGHLVDGASVREQVTSDAAAKELTKGKVVRWNRLNFDFNRSRFDARSRIELPAGFRTGPLRRDAFGWSEGSVIPKSFWDTAEDFERSAIAFAVFHHDTPVSVAFSAFALPGRLEIGIETNAAFRGRGLATAACAAFIEHCLREQLTPVWSCRKGNAGSERTAFGLGFEPTRELPYFALVE